MAKDTSENECQNLGPQKLTTWHVLVQLRAYNYRLETLMCWFNFI